MSISASDGMPPLAFSLVELLSVAEPVPVEEPVLEPRSSLYSVFDEASYAVTVLPSLWICMSPALDWSSSRMWPFVSQARPEAPVMAADWLPASEAPSKRWLVNWMRAVMP